jgi:hypothetical protein
MPHLSWHEVADLAKKAGAKYPELVSAQYALESGWGQFQSGKNNFFGIKGEGTKKETREVINGKEVFVVEEFKDFASPEACINWLVQKWYLDYKDYNGVNDAPNREEAARELQRQGYATDPDYAELLIDLMDRNSVPTVKKQSMTEQIKLINAVTHFRNLKHQIEAWEALQASLTDEQVAEFTRLYRGGSGVSPGAKKAFPLAVPYFYQRDSRTGHGERMCQSSCIAMVVEYLFPEVIDGDDDTWLANVFKHGDTVSQAAQLGALKSAGVDGVQFKMNGSQKDIESLLDKGFPVPIGILHKGPITSPTGGGHWIVCIGHDSEKFYVHDPFGELNLTFGGYDRRGKDDGDFQTYSKKNLMKRWLIASNSDGWYYDFSKASYKK